ncbi:hypothetical protein BGZ65_004050 [Modicella reniformis]|uniref:Uncharacterized protein n=1 Tax=Modicella reniformis TaxID=1440133 RepID=A0A9P6INY9_9FUNG|nr:hypothetical protein BGZ65_004050 [Modicella reniformis]
MLALSSSVAVRLAITLLFTFGLSFTLAAPIDSNATITLSFFTGNNEPVPTANATIETRATTCVQIPSLANSFRSNTNQAILALYQDSDCQSYLYSVAGMLANAHGARSLAWTDVDRDQSHTPGETFTDTSLDKSVKDSKAHLIQVAIIALSCTFVLIALGVYLCYMDNKRNLKRGGYVPEPSYPTGHRSMAEVSGPGRSVHQYNSHQRNTSSTSSTATFLPPYGQDTVTIPNQVGTGVGLEPGAIQQGRNTGFGLGYAEANRQRHSRKDSDIFLKNAIKTPPHSPYLRPSSVVSDHGGVKIETAAVYAPA